MITKRLFLGIWLLSMCGALAVLPYSYFIGLIPPHISHASIIINTILMTAMIYGILCSISYVVLQKVDLKPFESKDLSSIFFAAIIPGINVGLILSSFNKLFFKSSALNQIQNAPWWAGLLASLYGSINEEILCRLFLLTLIYFILGKLIKNKSYRSYLLWASIFLVALIFGIGHLPAAFKLHVSSNLDIFRILFLNGFAGIIFGWLYCFKGFWIAVVAHFIADIILHVF